jgi:predicted GNAT family acetyltransferase
MPANENGVVDDEANGRFVRSEDGVDAQLLYRTESDRLILLHTEVPEAIGGRGIGGRLVRAAVDRAARTGETIAPWCPYARSWLEKHPDVAKSVTVDWSEPEG